MEKLILLSESLDITKVAVYREEWQSALPGAQAIRVVADKLQKIDTAGLQLLVALKMEATASGKNFSLSGSNEVLRSQADVLGLGSFLLNPNRHEDSSVAET